MPGCPYIDKIDRTKEGEEQASHVIPFQEGDDSPDINGQLEVCGYSYWTLLICCWFYFLLCSEKIVQYIGVIMLHFVTAV